ncbi:MAG: TonB-dependent receptor, partial [Candidatus Marinimicrobia bacterium]|nr:TonB-dependent receptor [Candidatus Neomarinimicrobiota bacterium]
LFVTDGFRIRFGAGRSVKSISLAYIYKPPAYFKYQKDTTVVEEVQIQRNPNLKAYSVDKAEVSLDWKLKDLVGFSLTGYFTSSNNRPAGQNYPWGYEQNPDTITSKSYSIYKNLGWIRSNGVELTMRTKRVGGFQYNLNITYRFSKTGRKGLTYDSSPDTSWEEIWYKPPVSWREKVIIDHSLTYVSNRLGVWITFDVQHIPLEHKKRVYRSNSTYLEVDGIPRLFYQGMSYPYYWENFVYSYTPHWIFNFRITKSISVNTEMSIYINNVFDDRGIYREPYQGYVYELNPPIYYGLEISTQW